MFTRDPKPWEHDVNKTPKAGFNDDILSIAESKS